MTRFIYFSDTHIGNTPVVYQQQPSFPDRIEALVAALEAWIAARGDIDFVIHGGDMVNGATRENIQRANNIFNLSVPLFLCLGNHDLSAPDSLDIWMSEAQGFFANASPNFMIEHDNGRICVMPNQWGETPYRWDQEQRPHFTPDQFSWLDQETSPGADFQIFVTHSPVQGIPTAQSGFSAPYHCPPEGFVADVTRVSAMSPSLRCVAGAHNHINSCVESGGIHFFTVSSFVEAPFEFKLVEVDQQGIRMTTHNLASAVSFDDNYDFDKTFIQGRARDRACEIPV